MEDGARRQTPVVIIINVCAEGTRLDGGVCNKRFGQYFCLQNQLEFNVVCYGGFYWNNVIYDRCNRIEILYRFHVK